MEVVAGVVLGLVQGYILIPGIQILPLLYLRVQAWRGQQLSIALENVVVLVIIVAHVSATYLLHVPLASAFDDVRIYGGSWRIAVVLGTTMYIFLPSWRTPIERLQQDVRRGRETRRRNRGRGGADAKDKV